MNKNTIRTENLKKTYTRGAVPFTALHDVSLTIEPGTFCCITGPSGHGKSTLLHLMGGLDKPTSGQIHVGSRGLHSLKGQALAEFRARELGFVFQFFHLINTLTVTQNIQLPMMLAGMKPSRQAERASELLEEVGLTSKARSRVTELSGGQMQRVAIARALANNPGVLLMDEPTGNLDSASERDVLGIVDRLHKQGKTIVMVTHNPEISRRAQQLVSIRDGRIEVTQ